MLLLLKNLNKDLIIKILSIVVILMLFDVIVEKRNSVFYNKIYQKENEDFLSNISTQLIILTVTGEEKFNPNNIKETYKELHIIHLLVLSGSNLGIIVLFLSYFYSRNNNSYLFLYLLAITYYFCYINFLHPVARAVIFYIFYDIISINGLKYKSHLLMILLGLVCLPVYYILGSSNSFLLSLIFSFSLLIYDKVKFTLKSSFFVLEKLLIFPLYMTIVSYIVSLKFFNSFNISIAFISNLLIVPFYDLFVLILYLSYFIGFIPAFRPLLTYIDQFIVFIFNLLKYLSYLLKLYNI